MRLFFLLLVLSCPAWLHAQASQQMQELSQEIHGQLDNLRQQSRRLTEQLLIAESELERSSLQVEALKTELSDLNTSLVATNAKLSSYSEKLIRYEERLKSQRKWIWRGAALIVLAALAKLTIVILRFNGIKLADWINILF